MKSARLILGLFAGAMLIAGSNAAAQTANKFYEIGPNNVGGRINSLVLDQRDGNNTTIYAGAATGGLFVHSENVALLNSLYRAMNADTTLASNIETWHNIPYKENGREVVLPIKSMVQGYDNTLYIGTGDIDFQWGSTYKPMSALGRGIYRFNPETATFTLIPGTRPASINDRFAAVNSIDLIMRDGKTYFFAATNSGVYRWVISNEADWDDTSKCTKIFDGMVDQLIVSRIRNVAYFASGNQLYRLGSMTDDNARPVNISGSNIAFGQHNTHIKLALSSYDNSYLYAMVIDQKGKLENLYLTTNDQTWNRLTTNTIIPFDNFNSGANCGALVVDPNNPKRVFMGGSTLWVGQGYVDGSFYQWTRVSASENNLNLGDYMSTVFNTGNFIHSGINQILPVYKHDPFYNGYYIYYFATDGGVYTTTMIVDNSMMFANINRGLNATQINGVAVSPDGAIITGANSNACPLIEPRFAHIGGTPELTWYDNGSLGNINHDANIVLRGSGGAVAASAFQQITPQNRRTLFMSANNGVYGRAYADYLDYTNTQTWTYGSEFVSDEINGGPQISHMYLWENDHDTVFNDSVTVAIDTLAYIFKPNDSCDTCPYDTLWVTSGSMPILPGYKAIFQSRAHASYPFEYIFDSADCTITHYVSRRDTVNGVVRNVIDTVSLPRTAKDSITVKNPLVSRMLIVGQSKESSIWEVYYSWRITDFTKVWSLDEQSSNNFSKIMVWTQIFSVNRDLDGNKHIYPRTVTMSNDGRFAYIALQDTLTKQSMIVRLSGFERANYFTDASNTKRILKNTTTSTTILKEDTLEVNGQKWIPRVVSSLNIDPRDNQNRIIVTFEDYTDTYANVAVINDIDKNEWAMTPIALADSTLPAFCALVEKTTGEVYVGTTNGVFVQDSNALNGATDWQAYTKLPEVPVTSIYQQTRQLPVRRTFGHDGANEVYSVFSKTKWPYAIYFGTYGRGVFMDMEYVTDTVNERSDPQDYLGIPIVKSNGDNSISIYPNPASDQAYMTLTSTISGKAVLNVYDLSGRRVETRNLGIAVEGENNFSLDCTSLPMGMYLVNITVGNQTATAKLMVR